MVDALVEAFPLFQHTHVEGDGPDTGVGLFVGITNSKSWECLLPPLTLITVHTKFKMLSVDININLSQQLATELRVWIKEIHPALSLIMVLSK